MVNEKKIIDNIIYPFDIKHPTEYVKVHYKLNDELEIMLEKSGYKNQFLKKYQKSLSFLIRLKTRCIENSNLFEKLLNEDEIYSIRLFGQRNIRILFTFMTINGESKSILLNAFDEKSTSDYKAGIRVAYIRIEEIVNFYNS